MVDIEEKAGDVLKYMMDVSIPDSQGKDFVDESIQILTCCISALIRTTCCKSHYKERIQQSIDLIKSDLEYDS